VCDTRVPLASVHAAVAQAPSALLCPLRQSGDSPVRQSTERAMAIVLQESMRGLFYAPFYVALTHGAYAVEGIEVHFVSAPRPGDAARGLFDGSVDVCWGGPMRVMETYELIADCDLVSFAEVVTRDPFLLVGREPRPDFQLADLLGLRVATVGEVPTPWMCLQEDLRRVGIAPGRLTRVADRGMADNIAALRAGRSTWCSCSSRLLRNCSPRAPAMSGMRRQRAARPPTPRFTRAAWR